MDWLSNPYFWLLHLAAILAGTTAVLLYLRPVPPGARHLALLMAAVSEWGFIAAIEQMVPAQFLPLLLKLAYIGISLVPTAWLLFTLEFAGYTPRIRRRYQVLLWLEPALALILIFTNNLHGLFWKQVGTTFVGPVPAIFTVRGPFFWVHIIYSYTLMAFSLLLMGVIFVRSRPPFRQQPALAFIGGAFACLANLAFIFQWFPRMQYDLTPLAFTASGMLVLWGLYRLNLLDLIPIARGILIENMQVGVIVVDLQGRIVDVNQAASQILNQQGVALLGQPANRALADWPGLVAVIQNSTGSQVQFLDLAQGAGRTEKSYQVQISVLADRFDRPMGRLLIWNETTTGKAFQTALQRQITELTTLHAVASACMEAAGVDALLGRVTEVITQNLYTEFCGFLWVDPEAQVLRFHPSYHGLPEKHKAAVIPLGEGITGKVAQSGLPRLVNDVAVEPDFLEIYLQTGSELCVAIKLGEQVVGVLNIASPVQNVYSEADQRLLMTIAGQLGTALTRIQAEEAERNRVEELLAITRVSREITSSLELQEVLNSVVRLAAQVSHSDASGLFTYGREDRFFLVAADGVSQSFLDAVDREGVPEQNSAVGRAVQLRRPFQIPDIWEDQTYGSRLLADLEGIRAILALPLLRGDEVLGGIVLWHRKPRRFTSQEEAFLQALALQSVNAIENARVFELEREQRRLAEALRETGLVLSASLDFEFVLDRLLDQITRLVPYDTASVMVVEGEHATVVRQRGYENYGEEISRHIEGVAFDLTQTENLRGMIQTHQPSLIADVASDQNWVQFGGMTHIRSWVGAPVMAQDQVVAFFTLDKSEAGYYRQEHAEILSVFAVQAGLAIQNARLYQQIRTRAAHLEALNAVISTAASSTDLESLLQATLDQTLRALALQAGGIGLSGKLVLSGVPSGKSFQFRQIALARMGALEQAVCVDHWSELVEPAWLVDLAPYASALGFQAMLNGPIETEEAHPGRICLLSSEPRHWEPEEVALVEAIGKQLGAAVVRLRLFTAARDHAGQMALLAAMSENLNRPLTVEEVVKAIGQGAVTLGHTPRAAVFLRQPDGASTCEWWQGLSDLSVQEMGRRLKRFSEEQFSRHADPVLIREVNSLPPEHLMRKIAGMEHYSGVGLWPLTYRGELMAIFICYYNQPHDFYEDECEVMLTFSRQAAVALQNARLFEETNRRAIQLESLNNVIAEAVTAPNLASLFEMVMDEMINALQVDKGAIWGAGKRAMRDLPAGSGASILALWGEHPVKISGTLAVNDTQAEPANETSARIVQPMKEQGVHSLLVAPLLTGGPLNGGILLASSKNRVWLAEEIALVEMVGRQVGSAAERLGLLAKTQAQARQMQQIMDTVPEGVVLLNVQNRILLANPAARGYLTELTGSEDLSQPLQELAGKPIASFLQAPEDQPWQSLEVGQKALLSFEVAARRMEENIEGGWVLVLRDVTQERESQRRNQMQDRLATVGQLAAGIAHDFNNIMAAITVYTDLLAIDPHLSRASRERLTTIRQQVQSAASLIRQILDFSRRSVMEQSELDLLPFIKELDKLLRRVLPENIRLELTYQPGEYVVKADPTRLQQVFMNLALNSRDAMRAGGNLRFTLKRHEFVAENLPPVADLAPGAWISVAIQDSGVGITAEVMPHIFDPFFTTKEVGQGTGLGLAQVYGIIKQHGGGIDVQSQPGEGATFTIYLPAVKVNPSRMMAPWETTEVVGAGETVLVVEDDLGAREAMQALLETQNYHVMTAENGLEALQILALKGDRINLVISDVVMPEMGGLALYQAIQERYPLVKVIFVTGHPLEEKDRELLAASQVIWLQKPFAVQELTGVLKSLLHN